MSKHLSTCNLYQFKRIGKNIATEAMDVKLFLDNILLLEVYNFEGFQIGIKIMEWQTIMRISVTIVVIL